MRRVAIKIMKQEEALCFHKTVKKSTQGKARKLGLFK